MSYTTPSCAQQCNSAYKTAYKSDKHYVSSSYSVANNVKAIQTEIMTNGPVEVAFTVYGDFPSYKTGVYSHVTGDELGGHAVKMLGWVICYVLF